MRPSAYEVHESPSNDIRVRYLLHLYRFLFTCMRHVWSFRHDLSAYFYGLYMDGGWSIFVDWIIRKEVFANKNKGGIYFWIMYFIV